MGKRSVLSFETFTATLQRPVETRACTLEQWAAEQQLIIPADATLDEVTGFLEGVAPHSGFTTRRSAGVARGKTERAHAQNAQRHALIQQYERDVPVITTYRPLDPASAADQAYARAQYRRYLRRQNDLSTLPLFKGLK